MSGSCGRARTGMIGTRGRIDQDTPRPREARLGVNVIMHGGVGILTMIAGTLFTLLPGCALIRDDLLKTGEAVIEPIASKYVQFSRMSIHREEGELVVYGKVGRRKGVSGPLSGTVLVEVLDNQWSTSYSMSVSTFPERIPIRRSRHSHFVARLPETHAVTARFRVQYIAKGGRGRNEANAGRSKIEKGG